MEKEVYLDLHFSSFCLICFGQKPCVISLNYFTVFLKVEKLLGFVFFCCCFVALPCLADVVGRDALSIAFHFPWCSVRILIPIVTQAIYFAPENVPNLYSCVLFGVIMFVLSPHCSSRTTQWLHF